MFKNLKKKLSIDTKELNRVEKIALKAMDLEEEWKLLSDEQLQENTKIFREEYVNSNSESEKDKITLKLIANFREAARRIDGRVPYKVQIMGALIMTNGETAEMRTGEGKTLTAAMAGYLAVGQGRKVHIVTVNEYLVQRDAEEMKPVQDFLGVTSSFNIQDLTQEEKKEAYQADIMYSINSELGFDYLRDNMAVDVSQRVQTELDFVIIDEADSILIDEARTPLIISGAPQSNPEMYMIVDQFVKTLEASDYKIDLESNTILLEEQGIEKAEKFFKIKELYTDDNLELIQKINQALTANHMQKRDIDYVVRNGEILIVDKFTGRIMEGRSFSDGLHQAIEAKENVEIREETRTMATVTYQNFFKLYKTLSGMTGTAKTEEEEFAEVYNMRVIEVPTNKPIAREDVADIIFSSEEAKYKHVAEEIKRRHETGQPILVGTVSVEHSELLSKNLKELKVKHEVLNAKNHKRESEIISKAGNAGSVTIATNMAGRGTDIKLDEQARNAGGLAVIATERHESRRIDNQLRGRSGRQGDVGYSIFYVSLEDDLMKRYGGERVKTMMQGLLENEGAINSKAISNSISTAQKRVEASNYDSRKQLLKYDNVLNSQRMVVYESRNKLLERDDVEGFSKVAIDQSIEYILKSCSIKDNGKVYKIDLAEASEKLSNLIWKFENTLDENKISSLLIEKGTIKELKKPVYEFALEVFKEKEELFEDFEYIQARIAMDLLDNMWMNHIDNMTHLKEGIQLAQYAQKDPLTAYQEEGYDMFENFIFGVYSTFTQYILQINPART